MLLYKCFPSDNSKIFYCSTALLDVIDVQEKGKGTSEVDFPSMRKLPTVQEGSRKAHEEAVTDQKQKQ